MIRTVNDIVVAYTHPAGIDIRYADDAACETSLPLRLQDLAGYHVNMRRSGSWGAKVFGVNVRIHSVSSDMMVVNMLDDMSEPMHENTYVPLTEIFVLEVL